MLLYKLVPTLAIAKQISSGVFRFYELTKYIKIEDDVGRSDSDECSMTFTDEECFMFPEKIPTASFNGVSFKCKSIKLDDDYVRQYFVYCMSTIMDSSVIGDSKYAVELSSDIFETFNLLLCPIKNESSKINDGKRFFTHGSVDYYDIHTHPKPIEGNRYREVYLKRSKFSHQKEYRAALFVSDHFFNRVRKEPMLIECPIYDFDGKKLDFNLKLRIDSNIDNDGWRYIQLDISEFSANLTPTPSKIIVIST